MYRKSTFALYAAMVVAMLTAPAAIAGEFTAKTYPANVLAQGLGVQLFELENLKIECTEATLSKGELTKATHEINAFPHLNGCTTTIGGKTLKVTSEEVEFEATLSVKIFGLKGSVGYLKGKWEIKIEFLCAIKILPQMGLEEMAYEDVSGGRVNVISKLTGIKQTNTCGISESATASYSGVSTALATNSLGEPDEIKV
jgi:hypothetical protein